MFILKLVCTALLLITWAVALSGTRADVVYINPCDFGLEMHRLFKILTFRMLQILICVTGLHDLTPSYVLMLPDGTNCSGLWGLRSTSLEYCQKRKPWLYHTPYASGCFFDAVHMGDEMAIMRFDICKSLMKSVNETSPADHSGPYSHDIGDSHQIMCMNGTDVTTLYLPNRVIKVVVAASTYEKVINEMNRVVPILS